MRAALSLAVLCAASFVGDVHLDDVTSQVPPQLRDATLPRPAMEAATERPPTAPVGLEELVNRTSPDPEAGGLGAAVSSPEEEEDYYDDDEDEDYGDGAGDGPPKEIDDEFYEEDSYVDDEGDEEYEEDDDENDNEYPTAEAEESHADEPGDQDQDQEGEELTRRAEVRSLSDLPLSKLLRVRTELRRLAGMAAAATAGVSARHSQRTESCEPDCPASEQQRPPLLQQQQGPRSPSPSAQALNWGGTSSTRARGPASSTRAPQRRGSGWQYDEYVEEVEEEEEGGGWIWNKGKKKGKGDIGSIFHIAVTFLAFLAFGGYLLCLIIQAIKGKGYGYGSYGYTYAPLSTQGQLRPAANVMMLMMAPNRLTANRRPVRPATTGRRRRAARESSEPQRDQSSWWPSWGEEDLTGPRLWPHVDVDRMHRALLLVAEGYATYYHKRYVR